MTRLVTVLACCLATISSAQTVKTSFRDCCVVITNGVPILQELPRRRMFKGLLGTFRIETRTSTLGSFVLSGRVVSDNTGMPVEGAAISVLPSGGQARLAAISNVDGEFRFRVWTQRDPLTNAKPKTKGSSEAVHMTNLPFLSALVTNDPLGLLYPGEVLIPRIELSSIKEGYLCIGGAFDTNRLLVAGLAVRYSLSELTAEAESSYPAKAAAQ